MRWVLQLLALVTATGCLQGIPFQPPSTPTTPVPSADAPAWIVATGGPGAISVRWAEVSWAESFDLSLFDDAGEVTTETLSGDQTAYELQGLDARARYTVQLTAKAGAREARLPAVGVETLDASGLTLLSTVTGISGNTSRLFGNAVMIIDRNSDELPDLIVGDELAPGNMTGFNAGYAFVYDSDGDGMFTVSDTDTISGPPEAGTGVNEALGAAVAMLDGGLFAVSAPSASAVPGNGDNRGVVYVFDASAALMNSLDGSEDNTNHGSVLLSADVLGASGRDLIAGSSRTSRPIRIYDVENGFSSTDVGPATFSSNILGLAVVQANAARILVASAPGSDGVMLVKADTDPDPLGSLAGSDAWGGTSLATGDLDGDGSDDLLIGVSTDDEVRVAWGDGNGAGTASWETEVLLSGTGQFGERVVALDFNGDGYDDLVVGSPEVDTVEAFEGAGTVQQTSSQSTWSRVRAGTKLGSQISALGDMDGDGCDDLFVSGTGLNEGEIYRGGPTRQPALQVDGPIVADAAGHVALDAVTVELDESLAADAPPFECSVQWDPSADPPPSPEVENCPPTLPLALEHDYGSSLGDAAFAVLEVRSACRFVSAAFTILPE